MSSAHSRALWGSDRVDRLPAFRPPPEPVDVCVIGAGIAGLSVALCLLEAGRRVLVLDRDGVGGGETTRTSAHLASALDDRFTALERWFGAEGARLAAESHASAIDQIEAWCRKYAIACDFQRVDGYLCAAPEHTGPELTRELEAAQRAGLEVTLLEQGLAGLESLGPALRFARQARFQPRAYLHGLAQAVRRCGGVMARATVECVEGGTAPKIVLSDGVTFGADFVVLAANVPFHERFAIHTKQAAYRSFCIAAPVPKGSVPDALIWDDADPYHYVRLEPGVEHDLLIVGGEDHKTGQPEPNGTPYAALHTWARVHFPRIGDVSHAWSGQIVEPVDGLGFIGRDAGGQENVFVVTGDSGHGLTHGTLAGPLLTALIRGESHPWASLYDPARIHFGGASSWLQENVNVALQYADWLAAGGADSVEQIGRGQGRIVRHGLHRLAVYRDETGCLYAHSAVCPHLGASVRWNARERSWDCPAHGSRFDACDGRSLNGPAVAGLSTVTLPSE